MASESYKIFYYKAFDVRRRMLEAFGFNVYRQALGKQVKQFLELAERQPIEFYDSIAEKINEEPVKEGFEQLYKKVGVRFARETYGQIAGNRKQEFPDGLENIWGRKMIETAVNGTGTRIVDITNTTREILVTASREAVDQALSEGLNPEAVQRIIRKKASGLNRMRALRIARTEIVTAANKGALIGAESVGITVKKVWLSTRDSRTRDAHLAADGQTVDMDKEFIVNGEPLEYPGDPKGSSGNVINCRCAQLFEPV